MRVGDLLVSGMSTRGLNYGESMSGKTIGNLDHKDCIVS